ncbi:hypothetical protein PSHT_03121 [Puccinia striiformis]|uniref:Uncharacterized protein n=1 Tax=Puccinia striiformis TaxID=27350 RepID=A0A2S4WGC4_9BASI|nr:hypothetical protein PSHT_03121 [Puccinia striiformis]
MDCCDIIQSLRRLDPTQHNQKHNINLSIPRGTTFAASTSQSTSLSQPSPTSSGQSSSTVSGVAGGIAGCLAKTLVSPLDRVKILFQTGNPDYVKYTGSLGGVSRAIGAIWNQAGIRGLVQGHSATLFWSFMTYDILHKSLKRVKRQQVKDL